MQKRHFDNRVYFEEAARSCRKHYLPFIRQAGFVPRPGQRVLEVGCDKAGNLVPFAEEGCLVHGVEIQEQPVRQASDFFKERGLPGTFTCCSVFEYTDPGDGFDLIIMHDVIEHIPAKGELLEFLKKSLRPEGIIFVAFPAWRMPFGGHQQMAVSRMVSKLPFIHLLPGRAYPALLRLAGESEGKINGLMEIKQSRMTIRDYRKLCRKAGMRVVADRFYLVNPHYETKFGLKPRRLPRIVSAIPYVRDFFTSSYFTILSANA